MSDFWDSVARLPGSSAVVDYQPEETHRARYLTALHRRALAQALRPDPHDRLLDFGCGVGRLTDWLAPQVAEVIGVDRSPVMIEEASRRCRHANVRFRLLEPGAPRWAEPSVDGVLAIWVLQHILTDEELHRAIEYLAAAARPGALIYTLDRLCREAIGEQRDSYLLLRGREEYRDALTRHGLEAVSAHPVWIDERVLGSRRLTQLVERRGLFCRAVAAADLAWARRQRDPFLADYLCVFRRA